MNNLVMFLFSARRVIRIAVTAYVSFIVNHIRMNIFYFYLE